MSRPNDAQPPKKRWSWICLQLAVPLLLAYVLSYVALSKAGSYYPTWSTSGGGQRCQWFPKFFGTSSGNLKKNWLVWAYLPLFGWDRKNWHETLHEEHALEYNRTGKLPW